MGSYLTQSYVDHTMVPVLKVGPGLMMSGWGGGTKGIPPLLLGVDVVALVLSFEFPSSTTLGPSGVGGCGR